jgi:YD repeat-containing protein
MANEAVEQGCGSGYHYTLTPFVYVRSAQENLTLTAGPRDPNVRLSDWGADFGANWQARIAADLRTSANQRIRDWIAHDISAHKVDNPYHPGAGGPDDSDVGGSGGNGQEGPAPNLPRANCGDPVNCATGNFWESYSDLVVAGRGRRLELARTYNSQDAVRASSPGPFGRGWSSSYRERLDVDDAGDVTVYHDDGATAWFRHNADGSYSPLAWAQSRLSRNLDGTYAYVLPDQRTLRFHASGRLESIEDRNANATSLSYDGQGRLGTVTEPGGRSVSFTYNADGTVASATTPAGRVVHYGYTGGDLTSVTDARGGVWQFTYDAQHLLTVVERPRGGQTQNTYDAQGRVIAQTDPLGHRTTWAYGESTTTVTHPRGEVTEMTFAQNLPTRIVTAKGTADEATKLITYDDAFNPTVVTDSRGHETHYGYDSDGNRTTVTDPLGP